MALLSFEQAVMDCVMDRLREAQRSGGIPMDARTGHGAFFDRVLWECQQQVPPHVEPNGEPAKER